MIMLNSKTAYKIKGMKLIKYKKTIFLEISKTVNTQHR